jgi:hypothetical protein
MTARFRVCRDVTRAWPQAAAGALQSVSSSLPAPHSRQALTNRPLVRHLEVILGLSADRPLSLGFLLGPSTLACPRGAIREHPAPMPYLSLIPSKTANILRRHFFNIACGSRQGSHRQGDEAHYRILPTRPENPN